MVNRQRSMVKKKKAGNRLATVIGYVSIHTYVSELVGRSLLPHNHSLLIGLWLYLFSISTAPNALSEAFAASVKPLISLILMPS